MKVLFTLLLVFSTASLLGDSWIDETFKVRPSWSGAWYNPDQSGHGISVEVLDDKRTVFFWYTYDQDGNPIWLTARGVNGTFVADAIAPIVRVEATAYYHVGMIFGEFDPVTKHKQEWGTIILDFPYWECNSAHMEWYPTMEGFTQGSTDLVKLTSLSELDCVEMQDIAGSWEVQFGYDAERTYPVEIIATSDPDSPDQLDLFSFEFLVETGCLWSGEIEVHGLYVRGDWSDQCGGGIVGHSNDLLRMRNFEHSLCNSKNECVRKNEVMILEDEGEYLIFSR